MSNSRLSGVCCRLSLIKIHSTHRRWAKENTGAVQLRTMASPTWRAAVCSTAPRLSSRRAGVHSRCQATTPHAAIMTLQHLACQAAGVVLPGALGAPAPSQATWAAGRTLQATFTLT